MAKRPETTEVMKTVLAALERMKRSKAGRAAIAGMIAHGMTEQEAQEEFQLAFCGCLWERSRGLSNRMNASLEALGNGRRAKELFPPEFYDPPDEAKPSS